MPTSWYSLSSAARRHTCYGGFAVLRHGDAGDRLGVVVGLRLAGRLMLKERPRVDATLQFQSIARAVTSTNEYDVTEKSRSLILVF